MGGCWIHTWDFFLWVDVGSILGTSFYGWMLDPYLGLKKKKFSLYHYRMYFLLHQVIDLCKHKHSLSG